MEGIFSDVPLSDEARSGLPGLSQLDEGAQKKLVHAVGEVISGNVSGVEAAKVIARVCVVISLFERVPGHAHWVFRRS
jgi:hypothetical protein